MEVFVVDVRVVAKFDWVCESSEVAALPWTLIFAAASAHQLLGVVGLMKLSEMDSIRVALEYLVGSIVRTDGPRYRDSLRIFEPVSKCGIRFGIQKHTS